MLKSKIPAKQPLWQQRLSEIFWINSVAISNDGSRVVAATFVHDYKNRTGAFLPNVQGRFGTFCLDGNAAGKEIWSDQYDCWDGVFGVAISGNGQAVASGGWLEKSGNMVWGLVRAYRAADGKRLLDCTDLRQRVSWVALSEDGGVLAAVADDVYVFLRDGKAYNPVPLRLGAGGVANRYVTAVALHPDGSWLAACDQLGHVYMATIENGAIARQFRWTAPAEVPFLSVAIARDAQFLVAGGGNQVFLFDFAAIRKSTGPIAPLVYDTTDSDTPPAKSDGRIQENIRWVAISADGSLLATVANRLAADKPTGRGLLVALTSKANRLQPAWQATLANNPNSTSIDPAGKYVAASDGYPTGKPAGFHLFDAAGNKLWDFGTCNMNWPMVISANGAAIAAGSDDGTVYCFQP